MQLNTKCISSPYIHSIEHGYHICDCVWKTDQNVTLAYSILLPQIIATLIP